MVEVSGLAVNTLRLFIKTKFGEEGYQTWLSKLDAEVQEIYKGSVILNQWFDYQKVFITPTECLCDLFFNGDYMAGWELGRFSADHSLTGVLKVFVKIGSVNYFVKRAAAVLPNFYKPMTMEVPTNEKGFAILQIPHFPGMHKIIEYRVAGWMERALEITGKSNDLGVEITKSQVDGADLTEYHVHWG